MKKAAPITLGIAIFVFLLAASSASAYISSSWQLIGYTGQGPLQYSVGTAGRTSLSLPAPEDGVVTSVSVRTTGAATTGHVVLVRPVPNGAGFMQFVSDPVPIAVPASADPNGVITQVSTSWPAKQGDLLGLQLSGDTTSSTLSTYDLSGQTSTCASFSEEPAFGLQFAYSQQSCGFLAPAISGGLESDYDKDGFADHGDVCLTDPARHVAPCDSFQLSVVKPPPKQVRKGKTISFTLRLTNNGPATDSKGYLQYSLQHGSQKHFKVLGAKTYCPAPFPFANGASCQFNGFATDESHDAAFQLRATGTGKATITAAFGRIDSYFNSHGFGTSIALPVKVLPVPKRKHAHKH